MRFPGRGSDAISPTAHYTGYVWARNGLSHPELASWQGRVLFETVRPVMLVSGAIGGPTLERYLLIRHRALDDRRERSVEELGDVQVLEVAAGLTPRGWRFKKRYGDRISYVEADLPDMAARKRQALERMGSLGEGHRVEDVDALRDEGPGSLASVTRSLDPGRPLVILTEGLLSYLEHDDVIDLWRRFAQTLSAFRGGRYFSDLHLSGDARGPHVQAFRTLLAAFVRGSVELHFATADEAAAALRRAGFDHAAVRHSASSFVRTVDAATK